MPEKNLLRVGSGKAGETHALVPALAAPDLRVYRCLARLEWQGRPGPVCCMSESVDAGAERSRFEPLTVRMPMTDQPPPVNPPPSQARTWDMLCHLSALAGYLIPFGNVIAPLIIWQTEKTEFPSVDAHGKEAVNFPISVLIRVKHGTSEPREDSNDEPSRLLLFRDGSGCSGGRAFVRGFRCNS